MSLNLYDVPTGGSYSVATGLGKKAYLHSSSLLPEAKSLFREYQESLGVDLGFQDFEAELASLPVPYVHPDGALIVAHWSGFPAGCVGLKPLESDVCELKRLYVRQAFRGRGIGRALCESMIYRAETMGYRWMRLDTLARLLSAVALYRDLGFEEIEPYYDNPLPEKVIYLERPLEPRIRPGIRVRKPEIVERSRSRPITE